jgi:hypothetical protein
MWETLTALILVLGIIFGGVLFKSMKCSDCAHAQPEYPEYPDPTQARIPLAEAKLCINCETVFPIEGRCVCGRNNGHTPLKAWFEHNPFADRMGV